VVARAARLGPGDWRLLAEATVHLVGLRAALRVVPVRRLAAWCGRVRPAAETGDVDVDRVVRLVEAAARRVPRSACLTRSLTLTRMLAVRGVATDLKMGARAEQGLMTAHAWVEREGLPLNDASDVGRRYEPLQLDARPGAPEA
jgi:hypothetical protein